MASSLQEQLAAIAAKSTHQLDLKVQKARHSKSLLFEPREAAVQRFDTIFQICFEGFEELCQLDDRFLPFGRNLFSEQSKSEERTQMTREENEELDRVIVAFLGLLGGRLLLKPGMKAAEWLVRRFQVHEHNTEAVLMTFLPFHASPAFPTLLSILPEQLPPNFKFLHPYVASLKSPPRSVIVAAVSSNTAFLTAFGQYVINVSRARHHSAVLLGFWASITAQAVSGMVHHGRSGRDAIRKQKEEDILLQVLPIVQSALLVRGVSELYLGACMIMAILATQAPPEDKVIDAMMKAVANGWNKQTFEDGLTCLAVLAEEKQDLQVPRSVSSAVLGNTDTLTVFKRVQSRCRVERLLVGVALAAIKRVISENDTNSVEFLLATPQIAKMPGSYINLLLKATMNGLQSQSEQNRPGSASQTLLTYLRIYIGRPEYVNQIRHAAEQTSFQLSQVDTSLSLVSNGESDPKNRSTDLNQLVTEPRTSANDTRSFIDLSKLPAVPSEGFSFLMLNAEHEFRQFSDAFRFSLTDEKDMDALLGQASLRGSEPLEHPNILSFLARIWTSDLTVSEKRRALKIARETLERAASLEPPATDLQALLPYLLHSLSDSSKAVRAEAAAIFSSLEALQVTSRTKSNPGSELWADTSLYGNSSSQVQWLSTSNSDYVLTKLIIPKLDDCILDGSFIATRLIDALNGGSDLKDNGQKAFTSASRHSLCENLLSHAIVTPTISMKLRLLEMFSRLGKIAGSARIALLIPYAKEVFESAESQYDPNSRAQIGNILIRCLSHRSREEFQLLKSLASGELDTNEETISAAFHRVKQLFALTKGAAQVELFDWLMDKSMNDKGSEFVRTSAVDTVRNIALPTDTLVHAVKTLPSVVELQEQPTPTKNQRNGRLSDATKTGSVQKVKLAVALRRITLVLELVESSKPERHPQLLKGLFLLLGEMHHYKILVGSDLIYLHGLLIGNLQAVVDGLKAVPVKDVDRSVVRADLIVECVRTTPSTQVHNAALLLMSSLASWAPDHVLHSVMPLFTFMSSTILKQGDDYSAHVTDQAVARIIPPLAASLRKNGKDLISGAADLLLSFTAAFEHIPLHRRAGIFQHLVQTLGADDALYAIAAMLIERFQSDSTTLSFVSDLMSNFAVDIQLRAATKYLDLVFDTLRPKRGLSNVILGYGDKDNGTAKQDTAALQAGLATALSSGTLRRQLLKELDRDEPSAEVLRVVYSELLEKAMQLVLHCKDDGALNSSAEKVLSALLRLMPTKDFIDASAKLMQTGTDEIRQQVFASLESRAVTAKRADAILQEVFIGVLPNCTLFITKSQPAATRRAAIACIDQIAEKFGKTDRAAIVDAAQVVAGDDALGSDDQNLRVTSLLCLASMVEVVGDEFIPILPPVFYRALDYLQGLINQGAPDQSVHKAVFSFATSVLDHLPWVLSARYLDQFLKLAASSAKGDLTAADVARGFCSLAARKLSAQDFFSAVDRTWSYIVSEGFEAVYQYVQMLQEAVQFHTKSTVTKNAPALFSVLLAAFDLRLTLPAEDESDPAKLQELHSSIDRVALEVVMKLNDATFRPFFTRLVEWATDGASKEGSRSIYLRCTSLYSFALTLFEQLKSLVTGYVSFLLEHAAGLLENLSTGNEIERDLLNLVFQTLASSFRHDQDEFWQAPAHFDAVAGPLLAQLKKANTLPTEQHLIPTITDLAAAAGSPEHHKTMNAVLMACMRHQNDAVRLATVKCERSITSKLNLDWLTLLPEMLPFISELQEDDDEAVERETLRWVKQIEDITGESLEGMLQ